MNLLCDLISNIKNALKANKKFIIVPNNSLCFNFLKLLFLEGFISNITAINSGKLLKVYLKYSSNGSPCFKEITVFSTPGKNIYLNYTQLAKLTQGVGVLIISTIEGLLTNQACIKRKLGGKIICYIS
jgi:small subunit ribosomal protein S8